MVQREIEPSPGGDQIYLRASTVLTSAMYFRNGQCILDSPEYVQVG